MKESRSLRTEGYFAAGIAACLILVGVLLLSTFKGTANDDTLIMLVLLSLPFVSLARVCWWTSSLVDKMQERIKELESRETKAKEG